MSIALQQQRQYCMREWVVRRGSRMHTCYAMYDDSCDCMCTTERSAGLGARNKIGHDPADMEINNLDGSEPEPRVLGESVHTAPTIVVFG